MFLSQFMTICPVTKKCEFIVPVTKKFIFTAILYPLAQGAKFLTRGI